ncbi:MAG TPA: NUDIX hydrolase [Victivallales bacterium]|nr:NUDIX hydrolase [Victivallales bacterium]
MPKILKKETKFEGKWLRFEEITYEDSKNRIRKWENVNRTTNGAVVIIAKIIQSNKFILIRQYRPPIDNYIIEFPAGLIDEGEELTTTALRELMEETGYKGYVKEISEPVYSSPGLSDESLSLVFVEVDGSLVENKNPKQKIEPTEDIEVILVEADNLNEFISDKIKSGDYIDAKLMTFITANKLSN